MKSQITIRGIHLVGGVVCADDRGMTAWGSGWLRWIWRALAVVVPVGVAVASNQVLADEGWNWWWSGLAVGLATVSEIVAYRLTRGPTGSTPAVSEARPGPSGQALKDSTAGGSIDQVRDVAGSVRLRDTSASSSTPRETSGPPAAPPASRPTAAPVEREDDAPLADGQWISGSHAGGSITQINGVGGDVNIERT